MSNTKRVLLAVVLLAILTIGPIAVVATLGISYVMDLASGSQKELREYEEKLGAQFKEAQETLETLHAEQARSIESAWEALPEESPLLKDWDFLGEVAALHNGTDTEVLHTLIECVLDLTPEEGTEELGVLAERLAHAKENGALSGFEAQFDPNIYAADEIRGRFYLYLLASETLNKMELAAQAGIPLPPHDDGSLDTEQRRLQEDLRRCAFRMLACRAAGYAETGHQEKALATCRSLFNIYYTLYPIPASGGLYGMHTAANTALSRALAAGEVPAEWRAWLLERMAAGTGPEVTRSRLLARAMADPRIEGVHEAHAVSFLKPAPEVLTYRVFGYALPLIELAERPLYEWEDERKRVCDEAVPLLLHLPEPSSEDEQPDQGDQISMAEVFDEAFEMLNGAWEVGFAVQNLLTEIDSSQGIRFMRKVVRTAFALEDYFDTHGSYPDHLDALVPDLLDEMPTQPVSGEPLEYKKTPTGYELLLARRRRARDEQYPIWTMGRPEAAPAADADKPEEVETTAEGQE